MSVYATRCVQCIVKLATIIKVDSKASLSIASTPRCRRGHHSFPWIAPLYPWSIPYNAECLASRHQVPFFESLVWLNQGLNPSLPDHWQTVNSLFQLKKYFDRQKYSSTFMCRTLTKLTLCYILLPLDIIIYCYIYIIYDMT